MKVLIVGHARHGKDTLAEILHEEYGLTYKSSSLAASEIFLYDSLKAKYGYKTPEECFEDRVNRRDEWHNLICGFNLYYKARLAKHIMEDNVTLPHRLTTDERELYDVGHADYGSRLHELIGEPNSARTRERLKNLIHACLSEEPRIREITEIKVLPNKYDVNGLDIEITVLPRGKSAFLSLVYPFSLEGK